MQLVTTAPSWFAQRAAEIADEALKEVEIRTEKFTTELENGLKEVLKGKNGEPKSAPNGGLGE